MCMPLGWRCNAQAAGWGSINWCVNWPVDAGRDASLRDKSRSPEVGTKLGFRHFWIHIQ